MCDDDGGNLKVRERKHFRTLESIHEYTQAFKNFRILKTMLLAVGGRGAPDPGIFLYPDMELVPSSQKMKINPRLAQCRIKF